MHVISLLALTALVGLPPDFSHGYFSGLTRPVANRLAIGRGEGPVILIVVDALRPDRLPAYGARRDTSPNLTQLADDGVIFTNYYVNGNWTRPSTASLLTGLPPVRHGVEREQDRLADQFVTLAEVLSSKKIPTGAVVGNGNAGSAFGFGSGFDFYADTVKHWQGLPSAKQVTELALPFVQKHRTEPFFLLLFFVDPHDPYHAPGAYEDMFVQPGAAPLVRSPHWEIGHYSPAQVARMTATYDGAVRYTDATIGAFFEQLKGMGIYEKATIIVTSDHGEAFGEHGVFLHSHHLYDEIIRAPLILRAPSMSVRGAYNHYLFESIDLLPTIAGIFGVSVDAALPGGDILEKLAKPQLNSARKIVISEFNNFGIRRRTVRTYWRKLVLEEPADEKEFLATVKDKALLPSVSFTAEVLRAYDLQKDPGEQHDLVPTPGFKDKGWRRLYETLRAYRPTGRAAIRAPVAGKLDAETYEDLKALGYIR